MTNPLVLFLETSFHAKSVLADLQTRNPWNPLRKNLFDRTRTFVAGDKDAGTYPRQRNNQIVVGSGHDLPAVTFYNRASGIWVLKSCRDYEHVDFDDWFYSRGNVFSDNHYTLPPGRTHPFLWTDGHGSLKEMTWSEWIATGNDETGSFATPKQ